MKKTAEEIALDYGLCRCGEGYTIRRLQAPDCPLHAFSLPEAMEAYADQFKPKWIPVSEDLPPVNVRVRAIITYGNGKMEEVHTWWIERTKCFDDFLTDIITHWQYIELPSAPERKEEGV